MSSTVTTTPATGSRMVADSLAWGLIAMLISNILQRGVGLARGIGFCHFLSDQQLGMWSLAQTFFLIAAPLAVLGMPGSFARFVEYYQKRGELLRYIQGVVLVSAVGIAMLSIVMLVWPDVSTRLIFGASQSWGTLLVLVLSLACVILLNTLSELAIGLRQIRLVSRMHLVNSLTFAAVGLGLIAFTPDWRWLVIAFGISSLLGCLPALVLRVDSVEISAKEAIRLYDEESVGMWQRVVPYAIAIWAMNLLTNLYDLVDRYMLLHLVGESIEVGQAMVGQYHSARLLPLLLISLGTMLAGILLPYITADWESGKHKEAAQRVQFSIKLTSYALWTASLGFQILAPWLFTTILSGKFEAGYSVTSLALVQTIWTCLFLLTQNFLWCAEKGKLVVMISALGLVLNIILNAWMIPSLGLWGAVAATTIANAFVLATIMGTCHEAGCPMDLSIWIAALLPASLLLGSEVSAIVGTVAIFVSGRSEWLFSKEERKLLDEMLAPLLNKLPGRLQSIWPS